MNYDGYIINEMQKQHGGRFHPEIAICNANNKINYVSNYINRGSSVTPEKRKNTPPGSPAKSPKRSPPKPPSAPTKKKVRRKLI